MEQKSLPKIPHPMLKAGIFSKLTYAWALKLCFKNVGEKCTTYDSLPFLKSNKLRLDLEINWTKELEVAKINHTSPSLCKVIIKTYYTRIILQGVLQCVQQCFLRLAQPILLARFIRNFYQGNDQKSDEKAFGMYLNGGLLALFSLLSTLIQHHTLESLGTTGMQIRIACSSMIYKKMLRLNEKSLSKTSQGKIVNLLANDGASLDRACRFLNYIWIIPLQMILATCLMWQYVQFSAVAGVLFLTFTTIPLQAMVAKTMFKLMEKISKTTDNRITNLSEIFSAISLIKTNALEKTFCTVVNKIRSQEMRIVRWKLYIQSLLTKPHLYLDKAALALTLITYVATGNTITADKVFLSAQFYAVLVFSMVVISPLAAIFTIESMVSIKRIQTFLLLEEKQAVIVNSSKSISLREVEASWSPEMKLFKDVNIHIPAGSLCALVGPVGAGKSTLLQLLLGRITSRCGTIHLGGTVSYASQESWIFDSSVRANILFGDEFDKEKYEAVVKACALEKDLESWQQYDSTVVGERGVMLSGGQKARINLARAIYRNADIYLLDDPLSAVDTNVGRQLFEECVVSYLRGKTVIFVTHQLQYLEKVDYILFICDGKVEIQNNSEGNPIHFARANFQEMKEEWQEVNLRQDLKIEGTNRDDIVNGDTIKTRASLEIYWEYAKSCGNIFVLLGALSTYIVTQAILTGADVFVMLWTKLEETRTLQCNDTAQNCTSDEFSKTLPNYSYMCVYVGLIISLIVAFTFKSIYCYKLTAIASKKLHKKMLSSVLSAPMRFFDTHSSGRLLNRFTKDMGVLDELVPNVLLDVIEIVFLTSGVLFVILSVDIFLIFVVIILGVTFCSIAYWYTEIAKTINHHEAKTKTSVFSHTTASFVGLTTIRAMEKEKLLLEEFDLYQDTHTSVTYLQLAITSAVAILFEFIAVLLQIAIIFSFIITYKDSPVSDSAIGLTICQSLALTGTLQFGVKQFIECASQSVTVERILQYTRIPQEQPHKPKETYNITSWPNEGTICFRNVSLKYFATEEYTLKSISFKIDNKQKVGIVGRTGSGKSSLINAILRLTPSEGLIFVDGVNIADLALEKLRTSVTIISQDPVLCSGTLRHNLNLLHEHPDGDLWNALEKVKLQNVVESLDFNVQDGGANFSVGQRQLLCLARAILRKKKILIMDEATANVDLETDELIQDAIKREFNNCTVLTIAHRLNTIISSDLVFVMDNGILVENDHPYNLLLNSRGHFYRMVEQTGTEMRAKLHEIAKENFYNKN